jgi:hypothetical protein
MEREAGGVAQRTDRAAVDVGTERVAGVLDDEPARAERPREGADGGRMAGVMDGDDAARARSQPP